MRKEVIGECELYLGDCLEILPTLGAIDIIITDPPYGMEFVSNYRLVAHMKIAGDDNTNLLAWICNIEVKHSKYIFCRWDNLSDVPKPKSIITWVKNNWSMGDLKHEHGRQTEIILFYPGGEHSFPLERPADVIKAPRTVNHNHPTEKPVQLMRSFIRWTAGTVLDPFMGSGTTGIACAHMGRRFIGIESNATYFDLACKRIENAYKQPDMLIEYTKPEQLNLYT